MRSRSLLTATLLAAFGAVVAASTTAPSSPAVTPGADVAELWLAPVDLEARDLALGPGGKKLVPDPGAEYRFEAEDTTGHTRGYDVRDAQGRTWDVKIGDEARPEMVASRLLWAIGYHQPVMHFVTRWKMTGGPVARPPAGRFRLESDHSKEGEWSWNESPFAGSRPHRGLLVVELLLNGWDFTANNNRIYRPVDPGSGPARWFVVQDLGATLGKTRWPNGTIDNVDDFLSLGFVKEVDGDGRVAFDYHGRHRDVLRGITAEDVIWTCRLLSRLSEEQMLDAFRAAGYPQAKSRAYVGKIRQKIREGLALEIR